MQSLLFIIFLKMNIKAANFLSVFIFARLPGSFHLFFYLPSLSRFQMDTKNAFFSFSLQ